jgi:hypothetical protein
MAKKFTPPINYTSRDFNSIKDSLINYAKKYYPNTSNDFNEASFGALMVDMISYVGDIMSFYLDYQASESFLDTAIEFNNIIRLAKQLGYRYDPEVTAYGAVAIFIKVPANTSGLGPDDNYIPILRKNTRFRSTTGVSFILTDDVDFKNPDNQVIVSDTDPTTGNPTFYAIKAYGEVVSGDIGYVEFSAGDFTPFPRYELQTPGLAEIISVTDSDGNEYYEVEYLSQDVVYMDIPNTNTEDRTFVPSILKPVSVKRRFVVDKVGNDVFLQFGQGSSSDAIIENDDKLDPNNVAIKMNAKPYISATSFDPTVLVKNNNLGVAPENTTLRVVYRANLTDNINVGVSSVTQMTNPIFAFENPETLSDTVIQSIITTAEVSNEEPIVGIVNFPEADEVKIRARNSFAAQNRAVTQRDYISLVHNMPPRFGSIRRSAIMQDKDSFKRNLNLYVVSTGLDGTLLQTQRKIKVNLKNWLSQFKMINDTVDIVDANIINLGISYTAIAERNVNKNDLLQSINAALAEKFSEPPQIGESFFITDVYNVINETPGVVDAMDVEIFQQSGIFYSDYLINLDNYISPDGRFINVPSNAIWEIKFIGNDIKGNIV